MKAQVTILDTEFKKHTADFHMIQSMNDANSMQHEEARRQAMKAVKQRLDEISRKLRFFHKLNNNYFGILLTVSLAVLAFRPPGYD